MRIVKSVAVVLLALMLLSPALADCDPAREKELGELVAKWLQRDGAAFQEIGSALSLAFVAAPRCFLLQLADEPEAWDSWLEGLQFHTFTVYREDLRASTAALLREMRAQAEQLASDDSVGDLAQALKERLEATVIREID